MSQEGCPLCSVRERAKDRIVTGLQVMDAYIVGENLLVDGKEVHFGVIGTMSLHDVVKAVMLGRVEKIKGGRYTS